MSSRNITTEYTRQELAADDAIMREAGMVRNAVLRRALAIAACEYAQLASHDGGLGDPDAGVGLMVCWVTRASDELERLAKGEKRDAK
jgi:hypothetical protein